MNPPWAAVAEAIATATGGPVTIASKRGVAGGCINAAWVVAAAGERYFVKTNTVARRAMFEAEADGLAALATADALRVPRPVCVGEGGGHAFLIMEYIETGRPTVATAEALGRGLACQHRVVAERFGWARDNTLGTTPQPNDPAEEWVRFWAERRLGHQLALAARRGAGRRLLDDGERLIGRLGAFFADYRPPPSLLHGDLWGGNWATDAAGAPFVFDPAVYSGDRETDLAMTELFGGFPPAFYDAYREAWPLDVGYPVRRTLYNLYHVLNHDHLFGGGYRGQAETMVARLLSERL